MYECMKLTNLKAPLNSTFARQITACRSFKRRPQYIDDVWNEVQRVFNYDHVHVQEEHGRIGGGEGVRTPSFWPTV